MASSTHAIPNIPTIEAAIDVIGRHFAAQGIDATHNGAWNWTRIVDAALGAWCDAIARGERPTQAELDAWVQRYTLDGGTLIDTPKKRITANAARAPLVAQIVSDMQENYPQARRRGIGYGGENRLPVQRICSLALYRAADRIGAGLTP